MLSEHLDFVAERISDNKELEIWKQVKDNTEVAIDNLHTWLIRLRDDVRNDEAKEEGKETITEAFCEDITRIANGTDDILDDIIETTNVVDIHNLVKDIEAYYTKEGDTYVFNVGNNKNVGEHAKQTGGNVTINMQSAINK